MLNLDEKMEKYRLAVDENGSPFVLNSKGSIDFGYITEEMNLPADIYWRSMRIGITHYLYHYPKVKSIGR